MRTIASEVTIVECDEPDELYRRYGGQQDPQPTFIALDLETGRLRADWDREVGDAVSRDVAYGFVRRYGIPLLMGDAANALLAQIEGLAQRVLDGAEVVWDQSNWVVKLDEDAEVAEEAIAARVAEESDEGPGVLSVWDIWTMGETWTAEQAGITALTTDAELHAIGERLLAEFREGQEEPHAVIDGLDEYLAGLRAELVAAAAEAEEE